MLRNRAKIGGVVSDSPFLSTPAEADRGHPCCHATCLVPRLFLGLHWPRSELSTTLYVLRTMTMPTANLGEIPCYSFCTPQKFWAEMVFGYSSSTSYSRGLRRRM